MKNLTRTYRFSLPTLLRLALLSISILLIGFEAEAQVEENPVANGERTRGVITIRRSDKAKMLYGNWELRYIAESTNSRRFKVKAQKARKKGHNYKVYNFTKNLQYTLWATYNPAGGSDEKGELAKARSFNRIQGGEMDEIPNDRIEFMYVNHQENGFWALESTTQKLHLSHSENRELAQKGEQFSDESKARMSKNSIQVVQITHNYLILRGKQGGKEMIEYYYRPYSRKRFLNLPFRPVNREGRKPSKA